MVPRFGPASLRYGGALVAAVIIYILLRDPLMTFAYRIGIPTPYISAAPGRTTNRMTGSNIPGHDKYGIRIHLNEGLDPDAPVEDLAGQAAAQNPMIQTPLKSKVYKSEPDHYPPIDDHFPYLTHNRTAPEVLENNLPPWPHVPEKTPLLIGFTRDWPLLLQCVSSYIAAGWPPSDIYVIENTGTFRANRQHELSLQNPFFLNHTALDILGVNVVTTPTLLSFSQLQNYYIHLALQRGWTYYFWSHQDVIVFSDEDIKKKDRDHDWDRDPFATIYERCVGLLRYLNDPNMPPWATHFFAYDLLTLVNRDAFIDVGGWDSQIPYSASDCDMYLRLHWAGYWQPQSDAGLVFDVSSVLDDIGALYRLPGIHATFKGDPIYDDVDKNGAADDVTPEIQRELEMRPWVEKHGETWTHLVDVASRMQDAKYREKEKAKKAKDGKKSLSSNVWQPRQRGGKNEPFYRDPDGFDRAMMLMVNASKDVFADKWGHRGCDLLEMGIEGADAWRLERDWDPKDGTGNAGGNWDKDWMTLDE